MQTDADARTLAFYDTNASAYSERKPRREDIEALGYFMAQIPSESKICDLGCGNGWASAEFVKNGHCVIAIDGSSGLALEAKRKYGLNVEVKHFGELELNRELDGLWACWSLHHVSATDFPKILQHVSTFIRPGGLFFFSIKGGTTEDRDKNDRLYARYEWSELSNLIEDNVDGMILSHVSWTVCERDGSESLRHQVFVKIAT